MKTLKKHKGIRILGMEKGGGGGSGRKAQTSLLSKRSLPEGRRDMNRKGGGKWREANG